MNVDDPDPIPLSALQHWAYCPRQCGLIHLEQAFDDNLHTQRGQAVHALVDQPGMELRKGLRIERALPVWHDALGLIGKADVVEFEPDGTPYPVEYKHGSRHKAADIAACDDLQLAAQALCLSRALIRARVGPGRFNADAVPIAKVGANTAQVQQLLDRVGFKHDRARAGRSADPAGQGALIDT